MSDHRFEKKVRQTLDDLKLTPSAQTWENIAAGLRAHRRRRVPFWLPLLLASLGVGGFLIWSPSREKPLAAQHGQQPAAHTSSSAPKPHEASTTDRHSAAENQPSVALTPASTAFNGRKKSTVPSIQRPPAVEQPPVLTHLPLDKKAPAEVDAEQNDKRMATTQQQVDVPDRSIDPGVVKSALSTRELAYRFTMERARQPLVPPAAFRWTAFEPTQVPESFVPNTSATLPRYKGWSFAVTASAGLSTVVDGKALDLKRTQVEDLAVRPQVTANFMSAAPIPLDPAVADPGALRAMNPDPSTISPSFAYTAGVAAQREISRRIALSAGLTYLQLNTRSRVGQEVNNTSQVVNTLRGFRAVTSYYRLEQAQDAEGYKNRYHFIELPLTMHMLLNKNQRLPLHWNAGVAFSRLLKSNSLHYDGSTGVYYNDDKLLNRWQTSVSTGASVTILRKTGFPVWVGPSARYNVTRLLESRENTSKHFGSVGIDIRVFLK